MARRNRTRRTDENDNASTTQSHASRGSDSVDRSDVIERSSTAGAWRRPPRSDGAPVQTLDKVSVNLDGLMELANMNMDELDALMDANQLNTSTKAGDRITATVSRVLHNELYFDIGLKSEATMNLEERPETQVGDTFDAFVLWTDGVSAQLSTRLSGDSAAAFLEQAAESGVPVEGEVRSKNSGGFVVQIGSVSAFCPISHIDRHSWGDLDRFVGQTLQFLVLETDEKVVVSRRNLQEIEIEATRDELWATIAEGDTRTGIVANITSFGIFVDLGGVDGLVPRSEASWDRNVDLSSLFGRGQEVEVHVLKVDHEHKKVTLSIKDPGNSPWNRVGTEFIEGGVYTGGVRTAADFGVFIELAPGVTGLMHRRHTAGNPPKVGTETEVRIVAIDHDRKRLELVPADSDAVASQPQTGKTVKGTVVEVLRNGVLIELEDGRSGWLAAADADIPPNTILAQRYRRGRAVQARIISVDERRNRVALTQKSETDDEARRNWRGQASKQTQQTFGTLGDLLKGWDK